MQMPAMHFKHALDLQIMADICNVANVAKIVCGLQKPLKVQRDCRKSALAILFTSTRKSRTHIMSVQFQRKMSTQRSFHHLGERKRPPTLAKMCFFICEFPEPACQFCFWGPQLTQRDGGPSLSKLTARAAVWSALRPQGANRTPCVFFKLLL